VPNTTCRLPNFRTPIGSERALSGLSAPLEVLLVGRPAQGATPTTVPAAHSIGILGVTDVHTATWGHATTADCCLWLPALAQNRILVRRRSKRPPHYGAMSVQERARRPLSATLAANTGVGFGRCSVPKTDFV